MSHTESLIDPPQLDASPGAEPLPQTMPPRPVEPDDAEASSGLAALWRRLKPPPRLNLALQGGGAHGAFTWGVLDALLGDERVHVEGISGSSAGAMNAVVMASGWLHGGRAGARQALRSFWTAIGRQLPFELLTQGQGESISLTTSSRALMHLASYFSPVQLNPFDLNPLRDLLVQQIDFEALRRHSPFKLFIAATQANSGRLRIFRESELSAEMLLASACLPRLHHAVTIDGEPYWDGGYSANPAVFPLFYECSSRDVLLVLLTPLKHQATPQRSDEIQQRGMEIAFSANFMREMRAFVQATEFAREGLLVGRLERRLCQMRFHMIDTQDLPSLQRTETKLIAHRPFLELLHEQGLARAGTWLETHAAAIGRRATVDLKQWF